MSQGPNHSTQLSRAPRRRAGIRRRLVLLCLSTALLATAGSAIGYGFAASTQGEAASHASVSPAPTAPPSPTRGTPIATAGAALARAESPTSAPTPGPAPTPIVPPAATPAGDWPLLAEERFERVSEQWPVVRSPSWSADYRDGSYQLQLHDRPSISYSMPLKAHDFQFGADVRIVRGQAGLFFLIDWPNDFYRFLIDTKGRYRVELQQVGVSQPLIDWTASDALHHGALAVNRIEARRVGDELAFYANGTLLTTYTLPAGNTLEGRIGLALDAPTGERAGRALFDNLAVRAPAT